MQSHARPDNRGTALWLHFEGPPQDFPVTNENAKRAFDADAIRTLLEIEVGGGLLVCWDHHPGPEVEGTVAVDKEAHRELPVSDASSKHRGLPS